MSGKTYWNLLVFFGVLCQGIAGTVSGKDIGETSKLLVRQKRVINRLRDRKEPITNAPYVVTVNQAKSHKSCVGVILSENIVITLAECVEFNIVKGRVYSGSAQRFTNPRMAPFLIHRTTDKRVLMNNHTSGRREGIALITVTPHFIYSVNTQNIQLAEGHFQHGLYGTVSGWGCNTMGPHETAHPEFLRSITVPIITNRECARLYENIFPILDSDICTFDATGHQYCGVNDAGAPLVIKDAQNVNKLTGILLRVGEVAHPDIFANLQHPIYRNWIVNNIRELDHI